MNALPALPRSFAEQERLRMWARKRSDDGIPARDLHDDEYRTGLDSVADEDEEE